jgi:hypothetical protein
MARPEQITHHVNITLTLSFIVPFTNTSIVLV